MKLGKDARAAQAARELGDKRVEKAVYAEGMENFLELQDDEEVAKSSMHHKIVSSVSS
jgi:hypothetical protein